MINISAIYTEVYNLIEAGQYRLLQKKINDAINKDPINVLEVVCYLRAACQFNKQLPEWQDCVFKAKRKIDKAGRDGDSLLKGLF